MRSAKRCLGIAALVLWSACSGSYGPRAHAGLEGADAGQDAASKVIEVSAGKWPVMDANAVFAGLTLSEWAAKWVQWSYAQTSCEDPAFDKDGSQCGLFQPDDSPVFFLATGDPGTSRTRCLVPKDKAVLVPMIAVSWDNAGVPAELTQSEDELRMNLTHALTSMTQVYLRVDGEELTNASDYAIGPERLSYTVSPAPNWYSCHGVEDVSGVIDPAFVVGSFALLPPTAAGERHLLEYGGTIYVDGFKNVNQVESQLTMY